MNPFPELKDDEKQDEATSQAALEIECPISKEPFSNNAGKGAVLVTASGKIYSEETVRYLFYTHKHKTDPNTNQPVYLNDFNLKIPVLINGFDQDIEEHKLVKLPETFNSKCARIAEINSQLKRDALAQNISLQNLDRSIGLEKLAKNNLQGKQKRKTFKERQKLTGKRIALVKEAQEKRQKLEQERNKLLLEVVAFKDTLLHAAMGQKRILAENLRESAIYQNYFQDVKEVHAIIQQQMNVMNAGIHK